MLGLHDNHTKDKCVAPKALLARFYRDRRGATAVEFVLLALPFMMLIFSILECCVSFAASEVLANATDDIARQIRTGQLRPADLNDTKLKQIICSNIQIMVANGCPGLLVDLNQYDTFENASKVAIKYTSDNDIDTTGFTVNPGPSLSKNMLRVFYKWPVMTDLMRLAMSNIKGGNTLQFASVTWQNEPFND